VGNRQSGADVRSVLSARRQPSPNKGRSDSIKGHVVHKALNHVSPLAVRVMLEIGCESVYGDRDWIRIAGNHDPEPRDGIGGAFARSLAVGALQFRHEPKPQANDGEIAGHLHALFFWGASICPSAKLMPISSPAACLALRTQSSLGGQARRSAAQGSLPDPNPPRVRRTSNSRKMRDAVAEAEAALVNAAMG
jgi:hypothetical protein